MRTTIDLPHKLVDEAMQVTHCKTKTDLLKLALSNIIQMKKIQAIKNYQGKVQLDIDLDNLRNRR